MTLLIVCTCAYHIYLFLMFIIHKTDDDSHKSCFVEYPAYHCFNKRYRTAHTIVSLILPKITSVILREKKTQFYSKRKKERKKEKQTAIGFFL